MSKFIVLSAVLVLTACTSPEDVQRFAKQEGWEDAEYQGYGWFDCSEDDWYVTRFSAVKNDVKVNGVICRGLLTKSATIRYE